MAGTQMLGAQSALDPLGAWGLMGRLRSAHSQPSPVVPFPLFTPPPLAGLLLAVALLAAVLLLLELRHRLRPASPLRLSAGDWRVQSQESGVQVQGTIAISNPHRRMEVFVPELSLRPDGLSIPWAASSARKSSWRGA